MLHKILLNLVAVVSCLVVIYVVQTNREERDVPFDKDPTLESNDLSTKATITAFLNSTRPRLTTTKPVSSYVSAVDKYSNVWCIFTKVKNRNSALKFKFHTLINSILLHSRIKLSFHIISDAKSQYFSQKIFDEFTNSSSLVDFKVTYHDVKNITTQLSELTTAMLPYFSSQPGAYYSDALFFISLGLHKVAPSTQSRAILLDVDTMMVDDIAQLFREFNKFSEGAVLGIGPELSPVYQHILYQFRSKHKHTHLGSPFSMGGFPGVNSGVLLLDFDRIRASDEYNQLLTPSAVKHMVDKYSFKGHLGDQDWYTLVGMEKPHLLHLLPCGWNRQLCEWWRDHGYRDVFDSFAHCAEPTHLYHGNCNTPIPLN